LVLLGHGWWELSAGSNWPGGASLKACDVAADGLDYARAREKSLKYFEGKGNLMEILRQLSNVSTEEF
jgi:hypothetical protein